MADIDAKGFEELLLEIFMNSDDEFMDDEEQYRIASITKIVDSHYLTRDRGLVVGLENGTEFLVTIMECA